MASRQVDGLSLALVASGGLFVYAGIKGYSIPHALQALISGQQPAGPPQYPITKSDFGGGTFPGAPVGAGSAVADFMQYVGKVPYAWGKANPKGWDCSGSVNYVLGHDLRLPIPGFKAGTFTGEQHGPSTFTWLAWGFSSRHMSPVKAANAQPNDLVIWQTHMGIVTGGGQYVSAYDTAEGTVVKPIHGGGPTGEVATFWRYPAILGGFS